jgi:hypothetical protein
MSKIKSYIYSAKRLPRFLLVGVPILLIFFGIAFALFGSYFIHLANASFGTWGDTSLINACEDSRGIVALVSPGTSCNASETEVTWLKDVDAGTGLSISRSSSGATLSLANNDGWMSSNDTWTYVSANSFKISGVDRTSIFTKGTRVKLINNSTTYYGVVISSSYSTDTTVTLAPNSDYSLANSAITNPYYSYEANPQGYPTWFNYAPTFSGFSTNPSTVTSRFEITGTACTLSVEVDTGGTSNSTSFTMTSPVAALGSVDQGLIQARDNGSNLADPGLIDTEGGSTTLHLYPNTNQGNWTASGNKSAGFQFIYQF